MEHLCILSYILRNKLPFKSLGSVRFFFKTPINALLAKILSEYMSYFKWPTRQKNAFWLQLTVMIINTSMTHWSTGKFYVILILVSDASGTEIVHFSLNNQDCVLWGFYSHTASKWRVYSGRLKRRPAGVMHRDPHHQILHMLASGFISLSLSLSHTHVHTF